ncbi:MAG: hypothetical protein EAZ06_01450 [Cytophagales bacterium]|nr:MAG: hypothetical protein EAZ06_01450 [Cytophagales bacterium]
MEYLSVLGIVIYVIYTIIDAVNKNQKTITLPQPQNHQPKTISTKEGLKTIEEVLQMALEQKQKKQQSKEMIVFENTSVEVVNYEEKSKKLTTTKVAKQNKAKMNELKENEHVKSKIQKYTNQDKNNDLKFDKDDLKRAFILSEILQKKY